MSEENEESESPQVTFQLQLGSRDGVNPSSHGLIGDTRIGASTPHWSQNYVIVYTMQRSDDQLIELGDKEPISRYA